MNKETKVWTDAEWVCLLVNDGISQSTVSLTKDEAANLARQLWQNRDPVTQLLEMVEGERAEWDQMGRPECAHVAEMIRDNIRHFFVSGGTPAAHGMHRASLQKIADEISALKLHPTTSEDYDAGYIGARNDAFAIVQEIIDNLPEPK